MSCTGARDTITLLPRLPVLRPLCYSQYYAHGVISQYYFHLFISVCWCRTSRTFSYLRLINIVVAMGQKLCKTGLLSNNKEMN